jgi:hypothetical protein
MSSISPMKLRRSPELDLAVMDALSIEFARHL